LCCEALGLPGAPEARGYIQSWWGTGAEIPERSAQKIPEVADQILNSGAGVDARVGPLYQEHENQLRELRRYTEARGWQATEFVDKGVSGARESRPALDELVKAAKRRKFDTLVVWRLDRPGRNLPPLISLLDELTALGGGFVSLGEGIDTSTAAGRLQLHILGAIAEFERARIAERVRLGVARAKAQGQVLGRPRRRVTDGEIS